MSVAVIIPFTSDEPWRVRARDHVARWWSCGGFNTVEGRCDGPWRKAVAVADAAARGDAEILVVADADVVLGDPFAVDDAIAAVRGGAAWAMPHGKVHRLDRAATEDVYDIGTSPGHTAGRTQRPYRGWPGGGIVVVARPTWERIPMDPRFVGWSGEDESWAAALDTLAGPCSRFDAALFHLWHPPQSRLSRRWGSREARVLTGRYRAARNDPGRMETLVGDARTLLAAVAA